MTPKRGFIEMVAALMVGLGVWLAIRITVTTILFLLLLMFTEQPWYVSIVFAFCIGQILIIIADGIWGWQLRKRGNRKLPAAEDKSRGL